MEVTEMIEDLIAENKAMLEHAKVSGVEFIDVLRKNIAALEFQQDEIESLKEILDGIYWHE